MLLFVYGIFALSAGARAGVQIATNFAEAPLAYLLSALAAWSTSRPPSASRSAAPVAA